MPNDPALFLVPALVLSSSLAFAGPAPTASPTPRDCAAPRAAEVAAIDGSIFVRAQTPAGCGGGEGVFDVEETHLRTHSGFVGKRWHTCSVTAGSDFGPTTVSCRVAVGAFAAAFRPQNHVYTLRFEGHPLVEATVPGATSLAEREAARGSFSTALARGEHAATGVTLVVLEAGTSDPSILVIEGAPTDPEEMRPARLARARMSTLHSEDLARLAIRAIVPAEWIEPTPRDEDERLAAPTPFPTRLDSAVAAAAAPKILGPTLAR